MPVIFLQAQNETEPNNIPVQANFIPLNGSISGALNTAGDIDWFAVSTSSDGKLNIVFDNSGNGDLKVITLFDNDGVTQLNSSAVGNGTGGINTDGLAAGTYYVKINGSFGTETGAYSISNNLVLPVLANDAEPNNSIMLATRLQLNNSITGHLGYYYNHYRDTADWFKVTTNNDGQLDIVFDNSGNADIKRIILFDTIGGPQLNAVNVGNGIGGFNMNGLSSGTYFIQIIGTDPNSFGPYKLSDSLEVPARPADIEPNNDSTNAAILNINDSIRGHIGYYYNGKTDTADWYKITIPATGKLALTLDNNGNSNIIDLNLYNASGSALISSARVGNGIGGLQTDTLAPGIYYGQVTQGDGGQYNQFGAYALSNTFLNTLPVTLTGFSGKLLNNEILLSWQTATESNNRGFELQKSMDGQGFSPIGFFAGHGNSYVTNQYEFTDTHVLNGSNFYRLKQIDLDNKFLYSSIIKIADSKFNWIVSGNPVSANTRVQLETDKTAHIVIQVISLEGKIIESVDKGVLAAGSYQIPISLGNAARGIYIIRLVSDDQSYIKKLVK